MPFLTISAALLLAVSGENVMIHAGTYNETIVIPTGISITGDGAQCVVIQKLGVTADTTLITMGTNSRIENVTGTLSSAGLYNLIGVDFPTGTSINAKIRDAVVNVTSTSVSTPTILGIRSSGTSATSYSSSNAISRSTVNVTSSSTGSTRGILISGPNRFSVRETIVYASGTGSNIVGCETTDASAVLEIKTSTIGGVLYDINRSSGTILVGAASFLNNTSNSNSFTVTVATPTTTFGIIGDLGNNTTYNLIPGTILLANLPATNFRISILQNTMLINGIINFTGTIPALGSIKLNIYKNAIVLPVFSIQLTTGQTSAFNNTTSCSFTPSDYYYATLTTVGNPGTGTFATNLSFY